MGGASNYYIYILASRRHGTLYIGVTNDLRKKTSAASQRSRLGIRQEMLCTSSRSHGSFPIAAGSNRT
jgi:hypothetical protein